MLATLLVALLRLLLRILGVHFALRLGQHPQIMLCVLLKALSRHAVMAQLRITGQLVVFVDNLLGRTANFALRTRRVENAVNNVSNRARAVAVPFGPRAVFR